ncbi:exosome complex RNA-binding protein Csl4 [Candidatus Altiarchaeota archaeon]
MSDDIVMIGDYIGTIEEYMPGEGTFSEEGKIYAARVGKKFIDTAKHSAEVHGKTIPELKVGQVVYGQVLNVKKSVVTLIVSKIQGQKGVIDQKVMIYVSNISDKYVSSPDEYFKVGDLVKAKIIKIDPNMVDVSTKGDMGVVKAFCGRCRTPLSPSAKYEGKMECPGCKQIEVRKAAKDYGNVSDY